MSDRDLLTEDERMALEAESVETPERREKKRRKIKTAAKGKRGERELAKKLDAIERVMAWRVPGSGSFQGTSDGDVECVFDNGFRITHELKCRKTSGWKTLERWRGASDVLVLQEDQQQPGQTKPEARVYMPWGLYEILLKAAAEVIR